MSESFKLAQLSIQSKHIQHHRPDQGTFFTFRLVTELPFLVRTLSSINTCLGSEAEALCGFAVL